MLPKEYRLKTVDFKTVKNLSKKTISSASFSLKVIKTGFKPSRFVIIVSSSVFKKAVLRNKLKRRLKSIILKNLIDFKPGLAVLIYPKKESASLKNKEAEKEIYLLFKKSKILKNV